MKRGFLISNGLAFFFAIVSIGWLLFDLIAYGILHPKMRALAPLTSLDENLGRFIGYGVLFFLFSHIVCFIANAVQIRNFRKASALGIIAFICGVASCVMLLGDIACLSDVFNEYDKHATAEGEWGVLQTIAIIRGACFFMIIISLIEGFVRRQKVNIAEKALKDEVVYTLVHWVGAFCGVIGLFFANAAFVSPIVHPLLYVTFPILFVITLIPYGLLAGYWLVIKLQEKSGGLYDEKQFQDISKAGLLSMVVTVPFLAMIYLLNYHAPKGPIDVLWFPFYLYFVMLVFSVTSLYLSRTE